MAAIWPTLGTALAVILSAASPIPVARTFAMIVEVTNPAMVKPKEKNRIPPSRAGADRVKVVEVMRFPSDPPGDGS
jgi:hypothetical protein